MAEMHALRNALGEGDVNEVSVWEECDVMDYAQYAERLLNVSASSYRPTCCSVCGERTERGVDRMQDEAMLFVSIRSASQVQVPKVLKVVEET